LFFLGGGEFSGSFALFGGKRGPKRRLKGTPLRLSSEKRQQQFDEEKENKLTKSSYAIRQARGGQNDVVEKKAG